MLHIHCSVQVGNGCIGNEVGSCGLYGAEILANVLFGHALYSTVRIIY